MKLYERKIKSISNNAYDVANWWIAKKIKDKVGEYHITIASIYGYYNKISILKVE